ncbi:hypothetical protein C7N43_04480 [Sphingobacteriales bacterium UPWRP_1]|nr:hypothetical protein B6N25_05015 [Sphingobacteriales bacterium TSM_CSS]PSJ78321.1 hypothetical protein C7N43_04480 [Sphingobacteriales bacterium UPWRP_1]
MRFTFFMLLVSAAALLAVAGCKARKETQKDNKNSPADTNIQTQGKTVFMPDTLPNLFTDADNGKTAMLKTGQSFNLLLEANMTTGYTWVIADIDSAIVQKVAENYFPDANPQQAVGVGGKQWYAFKTMAPGSVKLKLDYKRPWAGQDPPAKSYELVVNVAD